MKVIALRIPKTAAWAAAVSSALLLTSACDIGGDGGGRVGHLKELESRAADCPKDTTLAEYAAVDVTASDQSDTITAARNAALTDLLTQAAVCNGRVRIDAFTGSAAAHQVVYDHPLQPEGATQIARLRKVEDLVTEQMTTIKTGIADASHVLPADSSDPVAQFGLAAEWADQLAETEQVHLTVDLLTDGMATTGIVLNTPALTTTAAAADLAAHTPVATLPADAQVQVSGLAKTAGTPAPTPYVEALKTYYAAVCAKTGAASCSIVVDYVAR
jgi:hypothetical protein